MNLNCDFIAVPRIVLTGNNLCSTDKLVMGLITSLALKEGYCFASNNYLATSLDLSKRTINDSLSKLKKLGLVRMGYENNNARKIYIDDKIASRKTSIEYEDVFMEPMEEYRNYNRKSKLIKNNNIPKWMTHPEMCVSVEPTEEERKEMEEILSYYD